MDQSGNWGEKLIQSIAKQDFSIFPQPQYCGEPFCSQNIAPFALKTYEPDDWDVGFRLKDYIIYDYDKMDEKTTMEDKEIQGEDSERIPDLKSRFCTAELVKSFGWSYIQRDRDPPHFPQDKTGKIGSMDRKISISIDIEYWQDIYSKFLNDKHKDDGKEFEEILEISKKTDRDKDTKQKVKDAKDRIKELLGKYPLEFGDYVIENDYDIKIAFMIPSIGNHSILAFTGEGGQDFYGLDPDIDGQRCIGINIEPIEGINRKNKKNKYNYDYNQRVTDQRECTHYQRGCVFHNIPPGKYKYRYYPMNLSYDKIPDLVQIIAF